MFWDLTAPVYDLFADLYNKKVHESLCARIGQMIDPADEVLECACGTGMLSVCIAPRCKSLIATDLSRNMLKRAEKKCHAYANVKFREADILHLDYPDQSFDKVLAANVIHLLEDPYAALRELDRVCRRGGRLLIPTYVGREGSGARLIKLLKKAGAGFQRQFNDSEYRRFFEEAGYKEAEYTRIDGRLPCIIACIKKK